MIRRPPRSTLFPLPDPLPIFTYMRTDSTTLSESALTAAREQVASLRSEEHTSELQSRLHLVCRLLLEKKKPHNTSRIVSHLTQLPVHHSLSPRDYSLCSLSRP